MESQAIEKKIQSNNICMSINIYVEHLWSVREPMSCLQYWAGLLKMQHKINGHKCVYYQEYYQVTYYTLYTVYSLLYETV